MSLQPHQIIKAPLITEESQIQSSKGAQYTFRVDSRANKNQIREAVETIFPDVRVTRVNTMNYKGKFGKNRGTGRPGRRPNWKKAIVTLRDGDSIELI